MSENPNKEGSKPAALDLLSTALGRNKPSDHSATSSISTSTRNFTRVDLLVPSPDNGLRHSPGVFPSNQSDTGVAPVPGTSIGHASAGASIPTTGDTVAPDIPTLAEPSDLSHSIDAAIGVHGTSLLYPDITMTSARSVTTVKPDLEHTTAALPTLMTRADTSHTPGGSGSSDDANGAKARATQVQSVLPALAAGTRSPRSISAGSDLGQGGSIASLAQFDALPGPRPSITEASLPSSKTHIRDTTTTILEGMTTVTQELYECSNMFLPLKTASGIFLNIHNNAGSISGNNTVLGELEVRLKAILGIVQEYMGHGASEGLKFRAEFFCSAIDQHLKDIRHLSDPSLAREITQGSKGAETINTVINSVKSINVLCDVFQMDTQLHFGTTVVQKLDSAILKELYQRSTMYTARRSSYGEVGSCMPGTRVNILDGLTTWAFDPTKAKIYWLVGMAGTGKSTIAHSFCEILETFNMLGASFFCSRASADTSDVGCIIPGIAYQLASSSPAIKTRVVEAIEKSHDLVETTYWSMTKQFSGLISGPIEQCIKSKSGLYKVVVIDALDECSDQERAANFVRAILSLIPSIPLKILVVSREEPLISLAFNSAPNSLDIFFLHNVEKDIVRDDIKLYLQTALSRIHKLYKPQSQDEWPSISELSVLLDQCGVLFIYAATLVRYIQTGGRYYLQRLSTILSSAPRDASHIQTKPIDDLYTQILEQVCSDKENNEMAAIRDVLSAIVFLSLPLSESALEEILNMEVDIALDLLRTVIFVPPESASPVTVFHASFLDFVVSPDHCKSNAFPALVEEVAQEMLALQCLNLMNRTLKYNICGVPEESTQSGIYQPNPENQGQISEALVYACTHWAVHLTKLSKINNSISNALSEFLETHLLHWFECLSIAQKLETSIDILIMMKDFCDKNLINTAHINVASLVTDAKHLIQLCFAGVKDHCFEVYNSMPAWLPKNAYMRERYAAPKFPQVILGLPEHQSEMELDIQVVDYIVWAAFSPDGKLIIGGSRHGKVMVWNVRTGHVQAQLQGHIKKVLSISYSSDGKYIVSASADKTVKIWDAKAGEIWADIQGHTDKVNSAVFSPDNKFVASASRNGQVKIWKVSNGEAQVELQGHEAVVRSVGYSPDGRFIASGSDDKTVRIWDANTGEMHAMLQGHTGGVYSVVYSPDGRFIVTGSEDNTIKLWGTSSKEVLFELLGHTGLVWSVAVSPDSRFIVSGSSDKSMRIWNVDTRTEQARLLGHAQAVYSVSYSPDGQHIVSTAGDHTIKVWQSSSKGIQPQPQGHWNYIHSVVYSPDGRYIASAALGRIIKIWDSCTGQIEAELQGDAKTVFSVAYSPDGKSIASVSFDKTIMVWNIGNRQIQLILEGHTKGVLCVAYSPDGRFIASGSLDRTVIIWDISSGEMQAKLQGHMGYVLSLAYSPDGKFIASASKDKTVKVWNVDTGATLYNLIGHTGSALYIEYSPDGRLIASASKDTEIRIWDSNSGWLLATLSGHTDRVVQIHFSHDSSSLLSLSHDQTIRKWDLGSLRGEHPAPITTTILWNFQSGWLVSGNKSYWSPIHSVVRFAIHDNTICVGSRDGKVFGVNFGIDLFGL